MHQAQHTEAAQRDGLDMLGSLKKICAYVWKPHTEENHWHQALYTEVAQRNQDRQEHRLGRRTWPTREENPCDPSKGKSRASSGRASSPIRGSARTPACIRIDRANVPLAKTAKPPAVNLSKRPSANPRKPQAAPKGTPKPADPSEASEASSVYRAGRESAEQL